MYFGVMMSVPMKLVTLFTMVITVLESEVASASTLTVDNLLHVRDCGYSQVTGRIRDGLDAHIHQFPWIVSIQNGNRHDCTGSLITARHVLTAAHCLTDLSRMVVSFGSSSSTVNNRSFVKVTKAFLSPNLITVNESPYGVPFMDVMILVLEQELPIGPMIRPICIAKHLIAPVQSRVLIAGFGYSDDGPVSKSHLQVASSKVLDPNDHKCQLASYWGPDTEICVFYGETSICAGDSGGPLMTFANGRYYLVGVAAYAMPKKREFGYVCANRNESQIFSRLSSFTDLILKVIGQNVD